MNTLGNQSKTTFLNSESHKLSLEFVANAAIKAGQPLKLTTTGKVTPWAKTDALNLLIGYAYQSAGENDNVTVFVRGYMVLWALSHEALDAGPVAYSSYDAATDAGGNRIGYSKYEVVGAGEAANAWSLDSAAGANALIRVLVMA